MKGDADMKRFILLVISLVLVFSFCSCENNLKLGEYSHYFDNCAGVHCSYKPEDITQNGGKFLIRNMLDMEFWCVLSDYHLEAKKVSDDGWRFVETINETSEGEFLTISPFYKDVLSIDWSEKYGSLPYGDYRLVLTFMYEQEAPPGVVGLDFELPPIESMKTIEFSIPAKEKKEKEFEYTEAWEAETPPYDITVEVEERAIENYGCALRVKNNTNLELELPYDHVLQAYVDGKWLNVSKAEDEYFDIAGEEIILSAYSEGLHLLMWDYKFGELPAGKYRVIFRFRCSEGEYKGSFGIPAEFEIK